MAVFRGIAQVTTEQYNELKTNGYIIVDGIRYDYDPYETLYITEQNSNISMDDQTDSVALGNNSSALGTNAVQLGAGNNVTPNTLQYLDLTVIDANGQVPSGRLNAVYQILNEKQNALTFDNVPTQNSSNPVTSGGIYDALSNKQDAIDSSHQLDADLVDDTNSTNKFVTSTEKSNWDGKQNALTFDSTPTASSTNPVTSDGILSALLAKQDTLTFDSTPTQSSNNPVTSDGIYSYINSTVGDIDTLLTNLNTGGGV